MNNIDVAQSKITYTLIVVRDKSPVRGNAMMSGDPAVDKTHEDYILAKLKKRKIWAWAEVTLVAKYGSFEARTTLGQCSYESEKDFVDTDYYKDMKREVTSELLNYLKLASEAYKNLTEEQNERA